MCELVRERCGRVVKTQKNEHTWGMPEKPHDVRKMSSLRTLLLRRGASNTTTPRLKVTQRIANGASPLCVVTI